MLLSRLLKLSLSVAGIVGSAGCLADDGSALRVTADVWADNWFALYEADQLIREDSAAYLTERSFNAESFEFDVTLPTTLSLIIKDYKANDTGLEYIGTRRQQMGDGGFSAQFFTADGHTLAVSDSSWRCIAVHQAPINRGCERDADPQASCQSSSVEHPENWRQPDFDDSAWPNATVHSAAAVRPHGGYRDVRWQPEAKLIWTDDLEIDNTILCRITLQ